MNTNEKNFSLKDIILLCIYIAWFIDLAYLLFGSNITFIIMVICIFLVWYFEYLEQIEKIKEIKELFDNEKIVDYIPPIEKSDNVEKVDIFEKVKQENEKVEEDTIEKVKDILPENELQEVVVE
jgi:hypothetical protein